MRHSVTVSMDPAMKVATMVGNDPICVMLSLGAAHVDVQPTHRVIFAMLLVRWLRE